MTARMIRMIAVTVACLGAFWASGFDITHAALAMGQPLHVAVAYPLVIDAAILGCALTALVATGLSKIAKFYAKLGRLAGFGFTIYANALSAGTADVHAIAMRIIPAVMLIFLIETIVHTAHGTATTRRVARTRTAPATAPATATVTPIRKRSTKTA